MFLLGFNIDTRVTNVSDISFFYDHFLSSFGVEGDSYDEGSVGGLALRLIWWQDALTQLFMSIKTTLFGLGQGIALTNFYNEYGVLTKELHNSYLTILVRNGLVGFFIVFLLHLQLLKNFI